jgi:Gamma-glutamyl cyclotransferase, AIG2-like
MSERVLAVVLGRVPRWSAAELSGYRRSPLGNGRCYPGVCPSPSSKVRGRVLHDVTPSELARLDRFEGDEYAAVVVPGVRLLQSGEDIRARMWVLADTQGVLEGEWSFDAFLEKDEAWYVRMCKEWADDDAKEQQQCTPQRRGGD